MSASSLLIVIRMYVFINISTRLQPSQIRRSFLLLAWRFGTKTRSQRRWQSAYGEPMPLSSSIVSYSFRAVRVYWTLTSTVFGRSCRACKYFESIPFIFNYVFTVSFSQLRSTWIPVQQTCAETNLPSSKLNLIAIPVTDISLLLIMLVGLFRMRGDGSGIVNLARVLWRQVILVLASRGVFNPLILFHFGKGIIWLLLALAAEVPPMVSLTDFVLVS